MEREKPSLGLLLEATPKVISVPRSSKRVELRMGNGNGMMTTNLGTVWKLLRPSWCPHSHASLIEEVTERVRLTPTKDEDLGTLDVIHKLILPQIKESGEATSKLGSVKKLEPGSCLDLTCGGGGHTCDGRSCVRIHSFQREDLVAWFGDITEREKSEVQIMAECYTNTTVNIATTQKRIRGWKIGLEAEMGFSVSEAYGLPVNAKSLVGSVMANLCGSHYPLHMAMVEVSSQRILVDKAFSVPKCV